MQILFVNTIFITSFNHEYEAMLLIIIINFGSSRFIESDIIFMIFMPIQSDFIMRQVQCLSWLAQK